MVLRRIPGSRLEGCWILPSSPQSAYISHVWAGLDTMEGCSKTNVYARAHIRAHMQGSFLPTLQGIQEERFFGIRMGTTLLEAASSNPPATLQPNGKKVTQDNPRKADTYKGKGVRVTEGYSDTGINGEINSHVELTRNGITHGNRVTHCPHLPDSVCLSCQGREYE